MTQEHTMLGLIEQVLNGRFPSQQEISERFARRAVLQKHGGDQRFCDGLIRHCPATQHRLTLQ